MSKVLIIGGSRGIGAAAVREFRDAGDDVMFSYHKSELEADELRQETGAVPVRCDIKHSDSVKVAVDKAISELGYIDVLICNAAISDYSLITDILAATLVLDTEGKILDAANELKSREYVVSFIDRWTKSRASGYRDFQLKIALSNGAVAELQLHHRKIAEVNRYLDHSLYEFVRSNEGSEGAASWIEQTLSIERAFYDAALNGKYDKMSNDNKIKARAIARRLASHSKDRPEEVQPLLNLLSGIVRDEFGVLTGDLTK